MKFTDLKDGDRVVEMRTDNSRQFFDMTYPVAVRHVGGVTDRSFVVDGMRFSRRNGSALVGNRCVTHRWIAPYYEGVEADIQKAKQKP